MATPTEYKVIHHEQHDTGTNTISVDAWRGGIDTVIDVEAGEDVIHLFPGEARTLIAMLEKTLEAVMMQNSQSLGIEGCECRMDVNQQLIISTMLKCPMHGFGSFEDK